MPWNESTKMDEKLKFVSGSTTGPYRTHGLHSVPTVVSWWPGAESTRVKDIGYLLKRLRSSPD
jgi:hypothetical protein